MKKYPYLNSSLPSEERAKDLLKRMSLKEKIEQMNCSGCLFDLDEILSSFEKNVDKVHGEWYWFKYFSLEKLKRMEEECVKRSRLHIPAFIACENVHGGALPYTTIFPTVGCLGASFDLDLAYKVSKMQAKEIRALGFNKVYAPNLDLFRDPRWGRCEENISEDPLLLAKMASCIVKGIQEEKVMATVKHYIGYSSPESGLNLSPMHMGEREIREFFLPSFASSIEAGAMGVMTCYNVMDGVPVTISPLWMNKVLREELKFDGVVILDYGMSGIMKNVMGISSSYHELGKKLLLANVDMEACEPLCYNYDFISCLKDDDYYLSLIDKSVYRILKAKFELGLFENPSFELEEIKNKVGTEEALHLTYIEEKEGATLLKNDGTLPLKNNSKILLIGPNANLAQLGGITYYAALEDYKYKDASSEKAITPLQALVSRFGEKNVKFIKGCNFFQNNEEEEKEIIKEANWADVIVFAGGNNSIGYSGGENGGKNNPMMKLDAVTSSEGYDNDDIGLTPSQRRLFDLIKGLNKKVVFLVYGGKPVSLEKELPFISSLLMCYGVGARGNLAIADILLGKINPSGRLPFSIARNVGQLPCFYNHYLPKGNYNNPGSLSKPGQDYVFNSSSPLFGFGFGLSYSNFVYDNFIVNYDEENIKVSVSISNDGPFDGDHVVLVYGRCLEKEYVCILSKRLIGFKRIHLKNKEKKTVEFNFTKEDFSYIGIDMKKTNPKGKIEIEIGSNKKELFL
ncbi:MAG TPA: hypothetical protein DD377_00090 [Firmicutes bacterium]|nr:hypothetical protein [Bacillota bacterium]